MMQIFKKNKVVIIEKEEFYKLLETICAKSLEFNILTLDTNNTEFQIKKFIKRTVEDEVSKILTE